MSDPVDTFGLRRSPKGILMNLRQYFFAVCAMGALLAPGSVSAHGVTVDGRADDWSTRVATADNLALIARNAASEGEYIWLDNTNDTRTDFATPESDADITRVQYTGTATGLAIMVRLSAATPTGAPVQVQVAIDMDRTVGSGQNFMAGFADTQVADAARWEFLVQTRLGVGGGAQVLNTAFTSVATIAAVRGTDGVEMFVPWSALGLTAPPAAPLRFTVATFRSTGAGDTLDIGGSSSSNALDVVSDYGDPRATAHPNTFSEVSDQIVNYFADVHFNTSGEVIAPLMVTHFVADAAATTAAGNEWVAVRNMARVSLALGGFRVGDEETVDGTEGMYTFPTTTLAPGATFVVAASGSQYAARYGRPADAEFATTAADTTPDMTRYTLWSSGSWGLANGGDEILVLDASNTIVDIVNYGTGVYAGVTAAPAISTTARVYTRLASLIDRDDNAMDFSDGGPTCAADTECTATCTACGTTIGVCAPRPAGASCSDGNLCNGAEVCSATGTCSPGTALTCNDGNPCTTDTCAPTTGCVATPVAAGTACADSNLCNGNETCNATGTCTSGTALVCEDSNPCTVNGCSPSTGCTVAFSPDGTSCGSTNVCTGREVCGSGLCVRGDPLVCMDSSPCTNDVCNAASGCEFVPRTSGSSCSDGNACNGAETCNATGACTAGTALSCNDGNVCTTDACSAASGCTNTPVSAGTSCSDGNLCNGAETCNATGTCTSGTALACNDSNPCTTDSCTASGGCSFTPVSTGTSCSDGNMCNGLEACNSAGECVRGTAGSCDDRDPCTVDTCDASGGCVNTRATAGTSCTDGNPCNGAETCNATGACVAGTAPTCNDGNPCTTDSCSPTMGCVTTNVSAGTSCSDSNRCNGLETCNSTGMCVGGMALTCDDGNPCTVDRCDSATGCATTPAAVGTTCSDGDLCNGAETCDTTGRCVSGTPVVCPMPTLACRVSVCNRGTGSCVVNFAPSGSSCDDGNLCNGMEVCDTLGVCNSLSTDGGLCADAGDAAPDATPDVTRDVAPDAILDVATDVLADTSVDSVTDSTTDVAIDALTEAAVDASTDTSVEAATDVNADVTTDATEDTADNDSSVDANDTDALADAEFDATSDRLETAVRTDAAVDAVDQDIAGDVIASMDGATMPENPSDGCGCRATSHESTRGGTLATLFVLATIVARRRRTA
jgi:MYXO-CTERM domain-containing protein